MENQNKNTGSDIQQYKSIAQKSVVQQGDKWGIKIDRPVEGLDVSKTYPSKELAADAVFNALKKQGHAA
jgi:hypothetical protein